MVEEPAGAANSFPLTTSAYRRDRGLSSNYSLCQVTLLAPTPGASIPWSAIESVLGNSNGKRVTVAYEDVRAVRTLDATCEFIIQCAPEQTFRVRMTTRADFQTWQDAFGAKLVRSKQGGGWKAAKAAAAAAAAAADTDIAAVARAAVAKAAAEATTSGSGANAAEQQPPPQGTPSALREEIDSKQAAHNVGHPSRRASSGVAQSTRNGATSVRVPAFSYILLLKRMDDAPVFQPISYI